MSNQGFFKLAWEDGQLLTRDFPKKSQNSPSDSIINDSDKKAFCPNFNRNTSSLQDKQHESSLPELYKSHNNRGKISYDYKLLKDSPIVQVHETAPTGNSQAHQLSLQQQHQVSAPVLERPRVKPRPNLFSILDVLPNSKTSRDHRDLEPEREKETLNFSHFLRSPAVPTSSTRCFSKDEKLQNKPVLDPAVNGSKSVKGFQNHLNSMDINAELLPPGANRPPDKSVPDVQSEAVNCQTSSLPVPSSSLCSLGASNNSTYNTLKRRYEDTEGSTCPSDPVRVTARGSKGYRKRPTPEVQNLSERRRRAKINKKMRALQELIPNSNKVDKASMLDEAIEYLKTLQFQVKMMSMGTGVCMRPMMLPTGMQQIHAPQMIHFSPMSIGMGMRMPMVVCNPAQFLIPPIPGATGFPGIPETRIQMPGFPGHPLAMSMLHSPWGLMHKTVPFAGISGAAASMELMDSAPLTISKDSIQNVEVNNSNIDQSKMQSSSQICGHSSLQNDL